MAPGFVETIRSNNINRQRAVCRAHLNRLSRSSKLFEPLMEPIYQTLHHRLEPVNHLFREIGIQGAATKTVMLMFQRRECRWTHIKLVGVPCRFVDRKVV